MPQIRDNGAFANSRLGQPERSSRLGNDLGKRTEWALGGKGREKPFDVGKKGGLCGVSAGSYKG